MVELSSFANSIFKRTYAFTPDETWKQCARRVASFVADGDEDLEKEFYEAISQRKFMPGGRYLYASGREVFQINNCLAGETVVVTSTGNYQIKDLVGKKVKLVTKDWSSKGQTKWVEASIKNFGKQKLWKINLSRQKIKKTIFATENHLWLVKVRGSKNRVVHEVKTSDLLKRNYNLVSISAPKFKGAGSPVGVMHGLVFGDGTKTKDRHDNYLCLIGEKNLQLESLFSNFLTREYDKGILLKGFPNYFKKFPDKEETYSYLLGWLQGYFAADGCVSEDGNIIFTSCNEDNIRFVKEICDQLGIYTFSVRKQERISNLTDRPSTLWKVNIYPSSLNKDFFLLNHHRDRFVRREQRAKKDFYNWKVDSVEESERIEDVFCAVVPKTHNFLLEDNILTHNCFLLRADDSREGWGSLLNKHVCALSTGGGVGTYYGDVRGKGTPIKRFGGECSGPISLMQMVNEVARHVMAGGKRRSALWAGLPWDHPDVMDFIKTKNWPTSVVALKEKDFNFPAPLDMTNISVCLDDKFFKEVKKNQEVWQLYYNIVKNMCKTGEPGLSIDVKKNSKDKLRNPCTEVVSESDSDTCNLGSIVLPRIESIEELKSITRTAVRFLYKGSLKGWMPHEDFAKVREGNRRIGLGIMGLHDWCLKNGLPYEPSGELGKWLSCWANISDDEATKFAKKMNNVRPIAVRAVAPTGTIGIVAETTTGIEPIFCVAYKRRYLDGGKTKYSYVIDPTAERAVNEYGADPDQIEDAYSLAPYSERRIAMQAFVQDFVDQAISSTINLPEWGEYGNNNAKQFAEVLLNYLPRLRGITVYPDGSRPGQPITSIKYETAKKHLDVIYEESDERCQGGVCGI